MSAPRVGLLASLLPFAVLATSLSAQTLIVDANGGPNRYRTIQSAVDAASDGSTLLILPGQYAESVTIRAKALVILGGGQHESAVVVGRSQVGSTVLRILDHPRARQTRLARLTIEGAFFNPTLTGVDIQGGGGSIVFDSVSLVGVWSPPPRLTATSFAGVLALQSCKTGDLLLTDVASTILQQCVVNGSGGTLDWQRSAPGLLAERSHVEVCRSSIQATHGFQVAYRTATAGGHGIALTNATLVLRGLPTDVIAGGDENAVYWPFGAGSALQLSQSTAVYSGVTLRSGSAISQPPPVLLDSRSSAFSIAPPAPTLERSDTFRYGRTSNLVLRGKPGDLGITLIAQRFGLAAFPFGNLHLDLASVLFPMASVLDAGGQAVMPLSLAGIDPTFIGGLLLAQAVVLDARSNPTLTGPLASIVLW